MQDKIITTTALIDSGAAGNFASHDFALQHKLKLTPCNSPLAVEALEDLPLSEGRVLHITEEVANRNPALWINQILRHPLTQSLYNSCITLAAHT